MNCPARTHTRLRELSAIQKQLLDTVNRDNAGTRALQLLCRRVAPLEGGTQQGKYKQSRHKIRCKGDFKISLFWKMPV